MEGEREREREREIAQLPGGSGIESPLDLTYLFVGQLLCVD